MVFSQFSVEFISKTLFFWFHPSVSTQQSIQGLLPAYEGHCMCGRGKEGGRVWGNVWCDGFGDQATTCLLPCPAGVEWTQSGSSKNLQSRIIWLLAIDHHQQHLACMQNMARAFIYVFMHLSNLFITIQTTWQSKKLIVSHPVTFQNTFCIGLHFQILFS